mmetsp:Transcript_44671/g.97174  ORF Transcript_44671/g.97174 Transcript_44671/m.97174 type:complete len:232 (+) Transcript_44671:1381-2076(+)
MLPVNPSRGIDTRGLSRRCNLFSVWSPLFVALCQLDTAKPLPHRLEPAECLTISCRKMHPDAPDILPALVAHPVEVSELHCVVTVLSPSIADMRLPPAGGIQPLRTVNAGLVPKHISDVVRAGAIVVVAPSDGVPIQGVESFVSWPALGVWVPASLHLTDNLVPTLNSSLPELERHCVHGVTVESVRTSQVQQLRESSPRWLPFWSEVLLPRLISPQDSDPRRLELTRDTR